MSYDVLLLLIKHIFIIILILLSFYGWGTIILKLYKMEFSNQVEQYYVATAIGMVFFITYIMLLGLLHIVYTGTVYVYLIGIIGIYFSKLKLSNIRWILVIFLISLPILYFTLYPPTKWDDISFHLPISDSILKNHSFVVNEYIRYPFFPMNGEILFVFGLVFDTLSPQLISWSCVFLVAVLCFEFVSGYFKSNLSGFLSVIVFLSNAVLISLGTVSYIDMILAFFVTISIITFCKYINGDNVKWLYISGIFLGTSVGIKYTALAFCIIIGLILIILKKFKPFFCYTIIIFTSGIVWYLRNLYYVKNPAWPFLSSIFGKGQFWNTNDYNGQFSDFSSSGISKDFLNFVKIPWILTNSHEGYGINIFIWFGIILFLVFSFDKIKIILLYSWISYTLFWFFSVNLVRYYMPIIPTMIIISSIGFYYFLKQLSDKRIRALFSITVCAFSLFFYYGNINNKAKGLPSPPVSTETKKEYIASYLPSYKATIFAASQQGKTYGLMNENLYFYGEGKVIGDWFGPGRYSDVLNVIDDSKKLRSKLSSLDVSYLLINKTRLNDEIKSKLKIDGFFKKIYEDEFAVVYLLDERDQLK